MSDLATFWSERLPISSKSNKPGRSMLRPKKDSEIRHPPCFEARLYLGGRSQHSAGCLGVFKSQDAVCCRIKDLKKARV